ncbi:MULTISPECIES: hypothetical protein [Chelatococcus]|uniref:PetM family of cytochrome b6f complex subunit 7 n=1 Tax=Chelatococcus caeni TaxID=1348468 RepID=A0A840CBQ2_9HYPH|nr:MULTISPECIES: hypothetical protein [Chelatococcus]ALA16680.1 hypothetical protein AL346_03685 [Chelatococcus sp. CO-6]MBB4019697.1 hypothetical protein [Chelatococcus caeni]
MRFVLRVVGFLVIVAGFVSFVIDSTRGIANGHFDFTPLGATLFALLPHSFPLIEPAVARHIHPFLWDPVLLTLFTTPTWVVALVIGVLAMWIGRRKPEPIGFATDR